MAIVAITFAGAIAWDIKTPILSDDWCYLYVCPPDNEGFWRCSNLDRPITTMGDAFESAGRHFVLINGRLANALHILWQPAGRLPEAIFGGIMIGIMALLLMLWGGRQTGTVAYKNKYKLTLGGAMLGAAATWIAFPWYDYMQSLDFQANYVWTTVLVVFALMLADGICTASRRRYLFAAVAVFFAGAMHEGFTLPLIAFFAIRAIVAHTDIKKGACRGRESHTERRRYAVLAAVATAAFAITFVSGTMMRLTEHGDLFNGERARESITMALSQMWVAALAVAAMLWRIWRAPKTTEDASGAISCRSALWRQYLPWFAAITVAVAIPVVLTLFHRLLWAANLFSVLVLLQMAVPALNKVKNAILIPVAIAFAAAYALWFCVLCHYQGRMYAIVEQATEQLAARRSSGQPFSSVVYLDDDLWDDQVPYYLMDIVRNPFHDFLTNGRMGSAFSGRWDYIIPLPSRLRGLPFDSWPAMPGNSAYRGVWPFFAEADSIIPAGHTLTVGEPENMPPLDRLLVALRGEEAHHTQVVAMWPKQAYSAEGDSIMWIHIRPLGRTMRHRRFIAVDTIM